MVLSRREVVPGLFVGTLSGRVDAVYVADRKQITAIAVAATELTRRPNKLAHSLLLTGAR